ncbi:MAG TPA: SMI1/KNR4 family protein, partial [Gemmatimonadales bacterium]|nr:SMI1/KNR4 family protein [Gemmatimonadales bacterium]
TLDDVMKAILDLEKSKRKTMTKGSTSEEVLDSAVAKLGIAIPTSLRSWLLAVNGAVLPGADLFGIGPGYKAGSVEEAIGPYNMYRERGILPVGGDGCGNDYVVVCPST